MLRFIRFKIFGEADSLLRIFRIGSPLKGVLATYWHGHVEYSRYILDEMHTSSMIGPYNLPVFVWSQLFSPIDIKHRGFKSL